MRKDDALLNLLAEARKHKTSIWLLHQEERQLSPTMLNALLTNCHVITAGGMSSFMAKLVKDMLGVVVIETGNDKGKPTIDLPKLKIKTFAAGVRSQKPLVLTSKKDALGDRFRSIPVHKTGRSRGKPTAKGMKMIEDSVSQARAIMREMYAKDVDLAVDRDDAKLIEFQEPRPI